MFEDFVAFFLPAAYPLIDFEKPVEFLEQELHQVIADKLQKGKVINDKLVKVCLKDGEEKWILIHIEIQSYFERDFSRRMFTYFYRIFDQYEKEITAIAIYTNESVQKNYKKFEYNFLGTKLNYEYNTYLIRDSKEEVLMKSENPFALAILATKYFQGTKKDAEKRFAFKKKLVELSREKDYSKQQIIHLFRFIDLLLQLPVNLEQKFVVMAVERFSKFINMDTLRPEEKSPYLYSSPLIDGLYRYLKERSIKEGKEDPDPSVETRLEMEREKFIVERTLAIQNLLKIGKLDVTEVAEAMNVPLEMVEKIKSQM